VEKAGGIIFTIIPATWRGEREKRKRTNGKRKRRQNTTEV